MYTPGPYKAIVVGDRPTYYPDHAMAYRIVSDQPDPRRREIALTFFKPDDDETIANGRLLEAAPLMADRIMGTPTTDPLPDRLESLAEFLTDRLEQIEPAAREGFASWIKELGETAADLRRIVAPIANAHNE